MIAEKQAPIPQAIIDAEKAVIGCLLKSEIAFWNAHETLRATHFSVKVHRDIFTAIYEICFARQQLSFAAILMKLPESDPTHGLLKSYLYALLENANDLGSPADFIDDLIEAWGKRQGERAAAKAVKAFREGKQHTADIVAELQAGLEEIGQHVEKSSDTPLPVIVARVVRNSAKAFENQEFIPGFSTGLPKLDSILGLIRPGRLYFLGGDQKTGKTALASQIIRRTSYQTTVLMAQTEMTEDEVGLRELGAESGISSNKMEAGEFTMGEYDQIRTASETIKASRLRVWQCGDIKLSQLKHKCLAVQRRDGLGFLMVDHLLNVHPDKEFENEFRGISRVVRGLKSIAMDFNIPVLCMTHRTRTAQDRNDPKPFATDHYGGGEIERSCDALLSIYRRDRWLELRKPENRGGDAFATWAKQLEEAKGKVQVALLAHRHADFPKTVEFWWDGPTTSFLEREPF